MAVTRDFVKSLPKGPKKQHYKYILDGMISTDPLTKKFFKEVGILLTSHPGNRPFLKASLKSYGKLGYFILLGYDNYWNPKQKTISYEQCLPKRDVFDLCDSLFITPYQEWGGVMLPYFFQLYQGVMTLGNFPYILCANGDTIIEKPEGFYDIFEMFKKSDADIFPCGWEENGGRPLLNTTCFIAKTSAIQKMMVHFRDNFIPFDTYEKKVDFMGNTESRFHIATVELGLKVLKPEINPVNTQVALPGGTWYDILGFRHIHGEWNNAHRRKKIPPPTKYLDNRYMTGKINAAKAYEDEKDPEKKQKLLEKWWKTG